MHTLYQIKNYMSSPELDKSVQGVDPAKIARPTSPASELAGGRAA